MRRAEELDVRPRRVTAAMLLTAVPGVREQMRTVPAEYQVEHEDGRVIACLCGRRPVLALGELKTCCRARAWVPTRAGCDRSFLASRRVTFVLGGPRS
jgi:hypothetical protein